ncbi:hypothetical protein BCR15_06350 [Tessaracoccus lapidicaptus]|uniref:Uncharacterized protein n=1 Tax=Tessaracoccus lapidicaptus TaxID=1427523 RepID=A0A1C0AL60_9ACTN|nr:hypothetical protein BKM78_09570 [Tessaracoccus sp. T2.5-30]OCL33434.1 hypothetical protein BCR15_06350 [Tessaracoccus lapidicaptus]VEP40687.1 hypothetical protein TLA_TLA_01933 [Tessaracoccus lapidicaptus]
MRRRTGVAVTGTSTQAQTAVAAALLRQLYAIVTTWEYTPAVSDKALNRSRTIRRHGLVLPRLQDGILYTATGRRSQPI